MKADAVKIRLMEGITGRPARCRPFALLERFEVVKDYLQRPPHGWLGLRTDRRRLEALLAVVDARHTLLVSGTVMSSSPPTACWVSAPRSYAVAAARAFIAASSLSAAEIVRKSPKSPWHRHLHQHEHVVEELRRET
jgi:ATP-dependent protease HslVU (ClpYQ) peptidase subunit